jgi:predicted ATPase
MDELSLRPKTLEVLWYLAARSGEVVELDHLLSAVWPRRVVTPGTLAVSIAELRRALGDDPKAPRYIQTVHRRGYRFVAPVYALAPAEVAPPGVAPLALGREPELQQLQAWYELARQGRRQILFVTGEAGIGKSTLVEAWLQPLIRRDAVWLGRGQCVEHSGAGEAYLALLEALSRLCRGSGGETVIGHLRQQAPGWLAQLSGVLTVPERQALEHQQAPVNAHHYQRELADALAALSGTRTLVLVLEDLQWCDHATVEALAVLSRRPEAARLLVIGTYRPVDLVAQSHPLRSLTQELRCHGQCQELSLKGLDEDAVRAYVARHLPQATAGAVAAVVYKRTAGQPLFMVNLTEYLARNPELAVERDNGALGKATVSLPTGLQEFIEVQIGRLSEDEQHVLEAGSVAGSMFAAAAVAAALGLSVDCVERVCEGLVRREQLIAAQGLVDWPDGTLSESYAFRHGLYQEVLYRRIGGGRRIRLHRAIGERLEAGHGAEEAEALAVELAEHFEQGRDDRRAVRYHRLAGETALRRYAAQAARAHLSRGLELLSRWPQDTERAQEELQLQVAIGVALIATEGFGAPALAYAYGRAHALCRQFPSTPSLLPVLCGLWNYFLSRADFQQVQTLAEELSALIDQRGTSDSLLPAHNAVGQTYLFMGAPARALEHVETGLADHDPLAHQDLISHYGEDPVVVCHMYAALADWLLGYPNRAMRRIETGLRRARELAQPFGVAQILWTRALIAQGCGDPVGCESSAQSLIELCEREDIALWLAGGRILRGWALAEQGEPAAGIVSIHQGLDDFSATGTALIRPYNLALLAEALGRRGRVGDGLAVVAEALAIAQGTGERWYEAELYRLQAEMRLQLGGAEADEAETGLQRALAIARGQQARALELRAAIGLARLWREQGRQRDARALLAPVYGAFTEGLDTADLKAARVLLVALARGSGAA